MTGMWAYRTNRNRVAAVAIVGLSLLMALSLLPEPAVRAQERATIVRPEPGLRDIGLDQVETVEIVLENGVDVYGIDLRASFDPAVVQVVDADPANDGIQMASGDFLQPDFVARNAADNEAGTLQYVVTQVNPTLPAIGDGVVLRIQFRGLELGASSELEIDFVDIADRRGIKLDVQPLAGVLAVVQAKAPTPTPQPAAAPLSTVAPTPEPVATRIVASPTPALEPVRAKSISAPSATPEPPFTGLDALLVVLASASCLITFAVLAAAFLVLLRRLSQSRVNQRRV